MKILIKGAGDLATGVALRLVRSGFAVLMTEIEKPTAVRRTVSFSEAVYNGSATVEGVTAHLLKNTNEALNTLAKGSVAVIVDESTAILKDSNYRPDVVIDAIVAKKNTGTKITDAITVIALGPGFTAGVDCHCVIETMRGHTLGRVIYEGSAIENTGIPGEIGGFSKERIIRSFAEGFFYSPRQIGDSVKKGDVVAYVNNTEIVSALDGIIRGLLPNGLLVKKGMKCGDIDPRCEKAHCFTASDKALAIGGGVLEAILYFKGKYT